MNRFEKQLSKNASIFQEFLKNKSMDDLEGKLIMFNYPAEDYPGDSSLICLAVDHGSVELIEYLLDFGYDPLIEFPYGGSLLHNALTLPSLAEARRCVDLIVSSGGLNKKLDANGRNVYELARMRGISLSDKDG